MQKLSAIFLCTTLLAGAAHATQAIPQPLSSVAWVEFNYSVSDDSNIDTYASSLLGTETYCDTESATCKRMKLETTPFSQKGKLIINIWRSLSHCSAQFEIPFTAENGKLVTASTSYSKKLEFDGSPEGIVPCPTTLLNVNVSAASDGVPAYQINLTEGK